MTIATGFLDYTLEDRFSWEQKDEDGQWNYFYILARFEFPTDHFENPRKIIFGDGSAVQFVDGEIVLLKSRYALQLPPREKSIIDTELTFGKHKGKTARKIVTESIGYVHWVIQNFDEDSPWVEIFKQALIWKTKLDKK